eukprot:6567579-Pyramimonas_sp.AAC.1
MTLRQEEDPQRSAEGHAYTRSQGDARRASGRLQRPRRPSPGQLTAVILPVSIFAGAMPWN